MDSYRFISCWNYELHSSFIAQLVAVDIFTICYFAFRVSLFFILLSNIRNKEKDCHILYVGLIFSKV